VPVGDAVRYRRVAAGDRDIACAERQTIDEFATCRSRAQTSSSGARGIESRDLVVPFWCQDVLTRGVREPTARHHALQRRRSEHMQRSLWYALNALEETASSTRSRTKSPADRLERESFHMPINGHSRRYAAANSNAVPPPHAPRAVRSLPSANPRVRIVRSAPRRRGPFAGNGRTAGAARVQGSRNSRVAVRRNGCRTGQIGQSRLSSSWC